MCSVNRRATLKILPVVLALLVPMDLAAQGIKVTLLGTGHPWPAMDRFGPSTLVEAGPEKLLFDCGRGASQRLWQKGIPLSAVTATFLTHLHSDHIVGIPDLWLTGWLPTLFGRRTEPFRVFGPAGTKKMMSHLQKAFQEDIRMRIADEKLPPKGVSILVEDITDGVVYQSSGVKVTAFVVDHGAAVKPAYGYRIDYSDHSVVISGDTRFSENLIRAAKGADVLIHEVAMAREELLVRSEAARRIVGHHTSPEEAAIVFSKVKPRLAVYSHIVLLTTDSKIEPPTMSDLISRTRKTYQGRLEAGEDLMVIDVGDTVEVHRPVATVPVIHREPHPLDHG
jgi:ribonuclease Z